MFRLKRSTHIGFLISAMLVVVSCVPKATEKKAVCGANQAFNSVTRTCYSIAEVRYTPVGTKSSETLSQETPKTITLTYTDKNSDQATSCKVSGMSANLEVLASPLVSGSLFDKADQVYSSAHDIVLAIPAGVDTAAANAADTVMVNALFDGKNSFSLPTVEAEMTTFKAAVATIMDLAKNYPTNLVIQNSYNLTLSRYTTFSTLLDGVINRCDCTGGVCSTTLVPKINQSGAAGFSYTITDKDGESALKAVTVSITAMSGSTNHLKPTASSSYLAYSESTTSTASNYTVNLPLAADLYSTSSFRYYFNGTKDGSNRGLTTYGKVTNCMDLTGSSGVTDTSCVYTPNDGDANDSVVVDNASVTINDVTYEAIAEGTSGNSITIQYFNLQSTLTSVDPYITETQTFGMVSPTYNESFIRVVGNAIKIFINPNITSSEDIRDLVNNHPQASLLVLASGGNPATFPLPATATPAAVSLSGGIDAFDSIPFYVNNGIASSTNTSAVMLTMSPANDLPVAPKDYISLFSHTETFLEEQSKVVTLSFKDVDSTAGNFTITAKVDAAVPTCTTSLSSAAFTAMAASTNFTLTVPGPGAATCTGSLCEKTMTVAANLDFNGSACLYYTITDASGATSNVQSVGLSVTSVNDAPEFSIAALPTITPIPDDTINESTTTTPSSDYVDIYTGPGGSGYESSQTLTLTVTSGNQTLVPDANLVVTSPSAGVKRITYTPVTNQSGSAVITVKLKDNGGTADSGVDETIDTFTLTVTAVDDPPYFASAPTTVETNEGGAVQTDGFYVDEDTGSSTDEDVQSLSVTAITSDNASVLPTTAIKMFYDLNDNGVEDTGESRALAATIENAGTDNGKGHKFYLKLDPIDGISGNSNITLTLSDGTNTTNKSFSFVVHPVAALHGGWTSISAVGIKTDKTGAPVSESEQVCNYNTLTDSKKCGSQACTGTSSPHGTIVPDAANVLFFDSANKKCYRSQSTSQFSWLEIKTSCPITRITGLCSDNNCISSAAPTPTATSQYYYDTDDNTCYISTSISPATWEVYVPARVTLSWKPFTISGSGADSTVQISGWSVFRREANADYKFKGGHLTNSSSTTSMTITDVSTRTFTDTTAIAGKVYYYVVRPVDSRHNFATYTPEVFSEVRVVAPPANYSFVHRWMINQEICNGMNMTTTTTNKVDQTNNFRCPYLGPGATGGYYDYGQDLLVDTQELGCAYSVSPKCTNDGCVGIGDPNSLTLPNAFAANDVFYDRGNGVCYIYSGGTWTSFDSAGAAAIAAVSNSLYSALNAPLTNVTRTQAINICAQRTAPTMTWPLTALPNASLPTKVDYMAYSAHKTTLSDADITDLEQGFSLNVQSRCNGSSASGLDGSFTDSNIPSTSFNYTIAGTYSSGIRSLFTGSVPSGSSKSTEACVSRFGIQDLYGNVAEWVQDQMTCEGVTFTCSADNTASFYAYDFDPGAGVARYGFNLQTGPFNDVNASGTANAGDGFLSEWTFSDELFSAGKFSYPTGMPFFTDIASDPTVGTSPAIDYLLDIGPSSGITTSRLHEDGIIVNGAVGTGAFAVGGSYLSGNRTGRFSAELIPDANKRSDVGLRCIIPIVKTKYPADPQHTYSY